MIWGAYMYVDMKIDYNTLYSQPLVVDMVVNC